jgi:hypothetical protein
MTFEGDSPLHFFAFGKGGMKHRQAALGATLAWPAVCYAADPTGLFVILFGVPSLLLSVVFAAVSLKAPRGGAVLCAMLLSSEIPLLFWAARMGYIDSAGSWLILALAIAAIGLLIALVKLMLPGSKPAPKDGKP